MIFRKGANTEESFKITIDNRDFVVICPPDRPKAFLDRTIAEIYEVPAKRINEAVKRNPEKFPEDFYGWPFLKAPAAGVDGNLKLYQKWENWVYHQNVLNSSSSSEK